MASPIPESLACNTGDADFQGIEVSEIDGAILMSFLEESQGEERDDEDVLNSIIRSLEAEINSSSMDGQDLTLDPEFNGDRKVGHFDGHDCAVPHDQIGFGWVDMEPVPSDLNWYMDPCGSEVDGIIEFGGLSDYSHVINYGIALDEEQGYRSLWQETYDTIMFD